MSNFSNLQHQSTLTRSKYTNTFFDTWSLIAVQVALFNVFKLAVNEGLGKEKAISVKEVVLLFDQSADLVSTAHALYLADLEELKYQEGTTHD